ncbi:MAG: hypothetical protein JNM07_09120 [Phycisphaerae bacterium]|nr:hypothetical protein [Phycisphaerae bacterium]
MSRPPAFRVPALSRLGRELRFIPPEAARRQLEAVESLVTRIDPARAYPEEWIVYSITGFRPTSTSDPPEMIVGEALIADLPALAHRLSLAAGPLAATGAARGFIDADTLAGRWGVTRRTLERLSRNGLVGRLVSPPPPRGGPSRARLVYAPAVVEAFVRSDRGRRFAPADRDKSGPASPERPRFRLTDRERRMVRRRALRYRARLGRSLAWICARLAARTGRSVRTIRRALGDRDDSELQAAFRRRKGRSARSDRLIMIGVRRALPIAAIAARVDRSPASVRRRHAECRIAFLRGLGLDARAGSMFDRSGPASEILAPGAVRPGLLPGGARTLAEFIREAENEPPPDGRLEHARALARAFLIQRAAELLRGGLDAAALDEAETTLRWASRLKVAMLRTQMPFVLGAIRARLGARSEREPMLPALEAWPARWARAVVGAAVDAAITGADRFDPFRDRSGAPGGPRRSSGGVRLAAPVTLAVDRAVARMLTESQAARAEVPAAAASRRARQAADAEQRVVDDWTRRVDPWQPELEPDSRLPRALERMAPNQAALLDARYGLRSGPPCAVSELARREGVAPARMSARLRALERRAIMLGGQA